MTNIVDLEKDIFDEIGVVNSTVVIMSLEPLAGANWTNVVFGVWPYEKNSTISSAGLSILRASFVSLVIKQSTLHLRSLFGDPSFFQVLKFPGGITVSPLQSGFLLQKGQILFNFTLNFSIYQIQEIFDELKYQLKSGLHLTPNENLYISLTNLRGSTLDPPIIVQSSVLLAVGNIPPTSPRLKQLAQAITGSPARNLGLNHTVFGKVKQIRLSSSLEHSLDSGTGSSTSLSPSPAPLPHPNHRQQQHHHHHNHHHHHPDVRLAPAPAPQHSYTPSNPPCHFRFSGKPKSKGGSIPAAAPTVSPRPSIAPTVSPRPSVAPTVSPRPSVAPTVSPRPSVAVPHPNADPPAPASLSPPSSSPLPTVFLGHVQPPSKIIAHTEPPDTMPSASPFSLPSSVAGLPTVQFFQCAYALLLCLLMYL
ncbi:SH3 domain-containing protein C23A1.17-like isoform X2 [Magnolia sinica]|nr:SH3 domain-containing protein C23A1.17-like isoform X2 [Magnolia sinica]